MADTYELLESILWERSAGYFLLDRHLARLARSGRELGFAVDVERVERALAVQAETIDGSARKVRITVARDGAVRVVPTALRPAGKLQVAVAGTPVDSRWRLLRHKTTARGIYDAALAAHPGFDDVLLVNERDELTETCHGNLVAEIDGVRVTPPVECGLLPGTFRELLLAQGEIREQRVPLASILDDAPGAPALYMINSVRRWCPIVLIDRSERAAALRDDSAGAGNG